jgi:propionyl-CoA carboxylase beta chain
MMGTKRILLYLLSVAWPSAEIAVMGAAGAADVVFRNHPDKKLMEQEYKDKFSTPLMAASRGYLDDIIQPRYGNPT